MSREFLPLLLSIVDSCSFIGHHFFLLFITPFCASSTDRYLRTLPSFALYHLWCVPLPLLSSHPMVSAKSRAHGWITVFTVVVTVSPSWDDDESQQLKEEEEEEESLFPHPLRGGDNKVVPLSALSMVGGFLVLLP